MDRTFRHLRRAARPPLLLLALLLVAAPAQALGDPALSLSLEKGIRIDVQPVGATVGQLVRGVVGPLDAPAAQAPLAPAAPPAPPAQAEQAQAPAPASEPFWAQLAPWALAGFLLAALVILLAWAAGARRAKRKATPPKDAAALRAELELCRMCSEAAVLRSTRLAGANARLREELQSLRSAQGGATA